MFERFTDRARRVLVFAEEEARRLRHGHVATEHLLLGLVREGDGVAVTALDALGVALPEIRERVEAMTGHGEGPVPDDLSFAAGAKKALELSLREAMHLGHDYIGTEHLVLGLLREGEGVAARVLGELGMGLPRVRSQVMRVLSVDEGADSAKDADPGGGEQAWPEAGWTLLASGTEATWRAVGLARQGAAGEAHPAVEVSDLIVGVLRTGDPQIAKVLAAVGTPGASPAQVPPADIGDEESPPRALSLAAREACVEAVRLVEEGGGSLRPAHLLLGCLSVLDGEEAVAVGRRLGIDVTDLRTRLGRRVEEGG